MVTQQQSPRVPLTHTPAYHSHVTPLWLSAHRERTGVLEKREVGDKAPTCCWQVVVQWSRVFPTRLPEKWCWCVLFFVETAGFSCRSLQRRKQMNIFYNVALVSQETLDRLWCIILSFLDWISSIVLRLGRNNMLCNFPIVKSRLKQDECHTKPNHMEPELRTALIRELQTSAATAFCTRVSICSECSDAQTLLFLTLIKNNLIIFMDF